MRLSRHKTARRLRRIMTMGLGVCGLLLAQAHTAQAYTRSCQAAWVISPLGGDGTSVRREFSADGSDPLSPNRARSGASSRIERCVTDHWAARTAESAPHVCSWYGSNSQVRGYPFHALLPEITALVCAANPGRTTIEVDVEVHLDGNTGCIPPPNAWAIELAQNVRINCQPRRIIDPLPRLTPAEPAPEPHTILPLPDFEPIPERSPVPPVPPLPGIRLPGQDIRSIALPGPDWRLCESACEAEAACRAWTYRLPTDRTGPVCLIKRGATLRIPDPCCHSGTIDR